MERKTGEDSKDVYINMRKTEIHKRKETSEGIRTG